ncbi:hypothetical protein DFH05DRAFT_1408020 [Lentinula detonsa]|nr:hypothetical protein DFH05DRAFT_1408020 [Lentinula detonsa]
MPSISRGTSGNFLTRMWGAAKGQTWQDKTPDYSEHTEGQGSSTFRRLVLVHSRSGLPRGNSSSAGDV